MSKDTKKKTAGRPKKVVANPVLDDEIETEEELNTTDDVVDETTDDVVEDEVVPEKVVVAPKRVVNRPIIERVAPKIAPQNTVAQKMSSDERLIKETLEKEPKVRFMIPLGIGEVKGPNAIETVTINGYRMMIPKGIFCNVPQSVADILERHYNMTVENTELGQAYRLDQNRSHEGITTDNALLN